MYTHVLLLVYEMLAADQWRQNMWEIQLAQLGHLFGHRIESFSKERLPYLVWNIVIIDMYAALSASGSGQLIAELLSHDLIPTVKDITMPLVRIEDPLVLEAYQELLGLMQKIVLYAAQLGRISRGMREPGLGYGVKYRGDCYAVLSQINTTWEAEHGRIAALVDSVHTLASIPGTASANSLIVGVIKETHIHVNSNIPNPSL